MLTDAEFKEIVRQHSRLRGAYKIACICEEVFQETSEEFLEAGNKGAVIHRDAEVMSHAVIDMRKNHILRG